MWPRPAAAPIAGRESLDDFEFVHVSWPRRQCSAPLLLANVEAVVASRRVATVRETNSERPVSRCIAGYGAGAAAQARADSRLDEVELAATRFGARWGLMTGVAFMMVLTLLPPVHSLLADIAGVFGSLEDNSMTRESRLFLLAIGTTSIAQETFRSAFTAAWKWSKR